MFRSGSSGHLQESIVLPDIRYLACVAYCVINSEAVRIIMWDLKGDTLKQTKAWLWIDTFWTDHVSK